MRVLFLKLAYICNSISFAISLLAAFIFPAPGNYVQMVFVFLNVGCIWYNGRAMQRLML